MTVFKFEVTLVTGSIGLKSNGPVRSKIVLRTLEKETHNERIYNRMASRTYI